MSLSKEEKEEIYRNYTKENKDKLIESYLPMVRKICNDVYNESYHIDIDDMFQTGCVGLVKAANSFDPSKNFSFTSYAYRVVKNEIFYMYRIIRTRNKADMYAISLDQKYTVDNNKDEDVTLGDMMPARMDTLDEAITHTNYNRFIQSMTKREQQIWKLYELGANQRKIARMMNLSQSYVSRLLKKLKERLLEI